jgi:tryptophanyl-tRNA synthetase
LIFNSNIVPVGRDQKQHVEVTRDIAIKFNNLYSETFVVPEPHPPRCRGRSWYPMAKK